MGKYYQLQCKRLLRYLPGVLLATLILLGGLFMAYRMLVNKSDSDAKNQKVSIALCGETDHPFLQMGITAMASFDSSQMALDVVEMEEADAARELAAGRIAAYAVIPPGFIEAAFAGDILQIDFYSTNGATGLVSIVKEELSRVISNLLLESQKGVYAVWDGLIDNDLRGKASGQMDQMAITYVDYILVRDRLYTVEELGIGDALGMDGYILCGLGVLFLLLLCLPFAAQMIPGDPALGRLLCSKRKPAWKQAIYDFLAYGTTLLCLCIIVVLLAFIFMPGVLTVFMVFRMLPVLLFAAAFSFMIYSLSRDIIGGVMLQFFVSLILSFVSGCLYPVYFFPVRVQQLAQWLPTGLARTQLAGCITGSTPTWTLPLLLSYCLVMTGIGVVARMQHIRGVRG